MLARNPDVLVLHSSVGCLKGEEGALPEGFGPGDVANFKFCPTANVDVERTFSVYETVLTDRRHRLTEENVVKNYGDTLFLFSCC